MSGMTRPGVVQITPAPRLSPLTQAEVVAWIRTRTAAQIAALCDALEQVFGVRAPAVSRPEGASNPPWIFFDHDYETNPPAPPIRLLETGPERLLVLKAVRRLTGLSLQDSKALVDNLPAVVMAEPVDFEMARDIMATFEALGARVSID